MVAARSEQWYTPAEYLARERRAASKSEYLNGWIVAMVGASARHTRIVLNLSRRLD